MVHANGCLQDDNGRNPDGTFKKGSEAAKAAGHVGGQHSHDSDTLAKEEKVSELEVQDDVNNLRLRLVMSLLISPCRTTPVATRTARSRKAPRLPRRPATRATAAPKCPCYRWLHSFTRLQSDENDETRPKVWSWAEMVFNVR